MKCNKCDMKLADNINFCPNCETPTIFFLHQKKDDKSILALQRKTNKIGELFSLLILAILLFTIFITIRGQDLFRPIANLEKYILNYKNGYNSSLIITNEIEHQSVSNLNEAKSLIISSGSKQSWKCNFSIEKDQIINEFKNQNLILNLNLCDISIDETKKLLLTMNKFYNLFPYSKGYLTDITISNFDNNTISIAAFKPAVLFVNNQKSKVYRTEILLNSYYFLNDDFLKNNINNYLKSNWFVKDANWESILIHELGHYLSYVYHLKQLGINNLIYINSENMQDYERYIATAEYNYEILKVVLGENDYSKINAISEYAYDSYKNGKYDEVIAEAVHDYYLHGEKANSISLDIISIIRKGLE